MPSRLLETQPLWTGGEHLVSEKERIPKQDLSLTRNWNQSRDAAMEAAEGYETEFIIPKQRQIADMEDGEDALWTGSFVFDPLLGAADTPTHRRYGFRSRKTIHAGVGTLTATFTRDLSFLFNFTDSAKFEFFVFVDDISELTSITVEFLKSPGVGFRGTLTIPAGDGTSATTTILRSAFTAFGGAVSPADWALISSMDVITTSVNSGVVEVSFDDFFVTEDAAAVSAIEDPVTGLEGFQRIGQDQKYQILAAGDAIYSWDGATLVKRETKLTVGRMVHMRIGNDQVFEVNGLDIDNRWDPSEVKMRPIGVPRPPGTLILTAGGGGSLDAGDYFAVVTFDMGKHGEGNPQSIASGPETVGALGSITYSSIPIGPPGTVRRIIYRSKVGFPSTGPFFLSEIVNDNITVGGIVDTKNDAALTDQLVIDADQPPVSDFIEIEGDIMWLAKDSNIFFSDITRAANRSIEQFDPVNVRRLNPDDGDRIIGIWAHRGTVYAHKRRSFFAGDTNTRRFGTISNVVGAVSQRSIVDDGRELRFWTPDTGPWRYNKGGNLDAIGPKIKGRSEEIEDGHKVNQEFLVTTTDSIEWTTIDHFNNGIGGAVAPVFTDTETSSPQDAVVMKHGGTGVERNESTLNSTVATHSVISLSGKLQAFAPDNAKDSLENTVWRVQALGSPDNGDSATLIFTLAEAISIIRFEVPFLLFPPPGSVGSLFRMEVQYVDGGGSDVTVGTFIVDSSDVAFNNLDGLINAPTGVVAQIWKLKITYLDPAQAGIPAIFAILRIGEFRLFSQGFLPYGTWESDIKPLGLTPFDWGTATWRADEILPDIRVVVKMRSGPDPGSMGVYQTLTSGQKPPTAIPVDDHVQILVELYSDEAKTPVFRDFTLTFLPFSTDAGRPKFESNGIYHEDTWYFNTVREGRVAPSGLWKHDIHRGWTEHEDYEFSVWTKLANNVFSGSSREGRVYRNFKDKEGNRIRNKDGRPMRCYLETANSSLGDQRRSKTIRDITIIARNENQIGANLLANPDLESWSPGTPFSTPNTWEVFRVVLGLPPSSITNNKILQETDPVNVRSGFSSAKVDYNFTPPGTVITLRQTVSLRNDRTYQMRFNLKLASGSTPNRFRLVYQPPTGFPFHLQDDGTWKKFGDAGFVTDMTIPEILGDFWIQHIRSFQTTPDIENATSIQFEVGYDQGTPAVLASLLFLDDFSIFESQVSLSRRLFITPIADDVPILPEQEVNLVGLEPGLIRARLPVDIGGVDNFRVGVRHEENEVGAKLMAIYTTFAREKFRDDGI